MVTFGFLPQNFEVAGTYEFSFCSKRNAASMVRTMLGGRDTRTQLDGKKRILTCCQLLVNYTYRI